MSLSTLAAGTTLVLACAMASAQQLPMSWDTPLGTPQTELVDGVECLRSELVIGLRDWSRYPELVAHAGKAGDAVLGAIPVLAAVRMHVNEAPGRALDAAAIEYRDLAFVAYAERNGLIQLLSVPNEDTTPDDPGFPKQWQLDNKGQTGGKPDADMDVLEAWQITPGSADIVACVIDSGIAPDHPEFQGRLLPGYDFADEDDDPSYVVNPHGVKVTGLIAAVADNGVEVSGIDQRCKVRPVRVASQFDDAQALAFAVEKHVDVVSMSFGTSKDAVVDAALNFVAASDIVMVAAAGNAGGTFGLADVVWPGAHAGVISVGSTDHDDHRTYSSSTGNTLDVVAPGDEVFGISVSGLLGGASFSGTSAAAPLACGVVTLIKSLNPRLSAHQVEDLLIAGAEDQVSDDGFDVPGWDPYYGHGRLNARRSLEVLCGCQGGESLIASPQSLSVPAGEVLALRIDVGRDHAGQAYWIFGSASGGSGHVQIGALSLPIEPDEYTRFTVSDANGSVLMNTHGVLDAAGQAMAFIEFPKSSALPSSILLKHIAVVFNGHATPARAVLATDVTSTTILAQE